MNIGRYTIELRPLTWWENEEIKSVLAGGAKMDNVGLNGFNGQSLLEAKLKTFEFAIKEIKEGDKVIAFSKTWIQGLTEEEGEAIEKAINELTKKK